MPEPPLQSQMETPRLQSKHAGSGDLGHTAAPPMVHQVLRSSGQPLDAATRAFMEPRFGQDFSGVRVHSGEAAEQSARDVNARAYTVGDNIVFGAGGYAPATLEGSRLIAHELTHVVQQSGTSARIARKTLTDLPAATRKSLRISRAAPTQTVVDGWVKTYFTPGSGADYGSGITAEFGADITDTNQQKGLKAIVGELEALSTAGVVPASDTEPAHSVRTDPEEWPLPVNSILDLALDLRPNGEHAIFRFTRFAVGATDKVLIEKLRVLAPLRNLSRPPRGRSPEQSRWALFMF